MSSWRRHGVGMLSMVTGGLGVLWLVGIMNGHGAQRTEASEEKVTSFVVEAPPPEPQPQKSKRPPPRRTRPKAGNNPSPPRIGNALGSSPIGLPLLPANDVGEVDEAVLGDTRDVVMTADTVDVAPRPLERPAPEIPVRIRKQGLSGRVVLNLLIGSDGRVSQTKTLESQPPGVFDEIATEAVRRWRFSPALYRGAPVPVWGRQTVEFGGQG